MSTSTSRDERKQNLLNVCTAQRIAANTAPVYTTQKHKLMIIRDTLSGVKNAGVKNACLQGMT